MHFLIAGLRLRGVPLNFQPDMFFSLVTSLSPYMEEGENTGLFHQMAALHHSPCSPFNLSLRRYIYECVTKCVCVNPCVCVCPCALVYVVYIT